ncbi:hypothetical protein DITRI_Ditri18aG0112500 [Diplodiscus trichospermus]
MLRVYGNNVACSLLSLFCSNPTNPSPLNTRTHVGSHMRDLTPTLKFLSCNIITINSYRIQDPRRLLLVNSCVQFKSMATKSDESAMKDSIDENKKGGEENLVKELPPPPEKPEPGDCCGSGCVRCVWDVYYEELEAYNKLYNSDSKNSISKQSS